MMVHADIPGWMNKSDLTIIRKLASLVPENGTIMEIGCFLGRSAAAWFKGKHPSVKLSVLDSFTTIDPSYVPFHSQYSVDQELYLKAFKLRTETGNWLESFKMCIGQQAAEEIEINKGFSQTFEFSPAGYDLVFVDGSHKLADVVHDISRFIDNEKTLIVGDDYALQQPGVIEAISRVRGRDGQFGRLLIVPAKSKIWIMVPDTGYWKEQFGKVNSCYF